MRNCGELFWRSLSAARSMSSKNGRMNLKAPCADTRRLAERARNPKQPWLVPNAGHGDPYFGLALLSFRFGLPPVASKMCMVPDAVINMTATEPKTIRNAPSRDRTIRIEYRSIGKALTCRSPDLAALESQISKPKKECTITVN